MMTRILRLPAGLVALSLFILGVALRLPGLTHFLTPDEFRLWRELTARFLLALLSQDWAGTSISGYPGVLPNWLGASGLTLHWLLQGGPGTSLAAATATVLADPSPLYLLFWLRLPFVLVGAAGVSGLYLLAHRILPRPASLLAAIFLLLDPFLLAHTRLLNTDGLLALLVAFSWLALLAGSQAEANHTRQGFYALSGMGLAGAFLTKSPALALAPLLVGWLVWTAWPNRSGSRMIRDLLWLGLPALAVTWLLWPALWVDPFTALGRIWGMMRAYSQTSHELGNFWLGQPVEGPGPLFYPLALLWRTTPALLIGLFGTGLIFLPGRAESRERRVWLGLFLFVVWFALTISVSPKKFDRYLLPIFPGLALLAALGWQQVGQRLRRPTWAGLGLALLLAAQVVSLWAGYPSLLTVYNPLVGGARTAQKVMLVGWGEGLAEAAQWIAQQPGGAQSQVAAWYGQNVFAPFYQGKSVDLYYDLDSLDALYAQDVDYVVTYINQMQRGLLRPEVGALLGSPLHTVTQQGVDLAHIYAWLKPFAHTVDRPLAADFHLLGWATGEGQNAEGETKVRLTLYWDAGQPGRLAEPPSVTAWIKDEWGEVWDVAESTLARTDAPIPAWAQRMALPQSLTLTVPAGARPGPYRVEIAAGGSTLSLGSVAIFATPATAAVTLAFPIIQPPSFGPSLTLLGYDRIPDPDGLTLDLVWAVGPGDQPGVQLFVHMVDKEGKMLAQHDGPLAPLTAGSLLRQRVRLVFPEGVEGAYTIFLGLYDLGTLQRLPAEQGGRRLAEDRFGLP